MKKQPGNIACPCGNGLFSQCCGRFIQQNLIPQNAKELMRSRYTAYVLQDEPYLKSTWYASSRPSGRLFDDEKGIKWIGLTVCSHEQDANWATVEFIARYKLNGRAYQIHEISRFVQEDGHWFYLDGQFPEQGRK